MGRGRRDSRKRGQEALRHRIRYEIDASSGFADEWRVAAALEAALASQPRSEALLEHALPATELTAVARAIGLELSSDTVARIRRLAKNQLVPGADGDTASLLRSARRQARQAAAAELARLAVVGGVERAEALSPSYRPSKHECAALGTPDLWEELVAVHWTTLPIFDDDHFHRFFLQSLPRNKSRFSRAVDALVAHGPTGGGAGGAEAAAVLAATTAATAGNHRGDG